MSATNCGDHSHYLRLCGVEMKELERWAQKHHKRCRKHHHVEISNTGVGDSIKAVCDCGIIADITHYDHW